MVSGAEGFHRKPTVLPAFNERQFLFLCPSDDLPLGRFLHSRSLSNKTINYEITLQYAVARRFTDLF